MLFYFSVTGLLLTGFTATLRKCVYALAGFIFPGYVGISELAGRTANRPEVVAMCGLVVIMALAYATAAHRANVVRARLVQALTDNQNNVYKMVILGDEKDEQGN